MELSWSLQAQTARRGEGWTTWHPPHQDPPKYSYTRDQIDNRKVDVLFNATNYFKISCYVREQPLTLTYQALLHKWKINERSVVYYHKPQKSTATLMETNSIATVKQKNSKANATARKIDISTRLVLTETRTTVRLALDYPRPSHIRQLPNIWFHLLKVLLKTSLGSVLLLKNTLFWQVRYRRHQWWRCRILVQSTIMTQEKGPLQCQKITNSHLQNILNILWSYRLTWHWRQPKDHIKV